jgi:hypothetical protein
MSGDASGDRGQSEVIAFLLLIALTIAGTTTIILLGFTALDTAKEDVTLSQTENAITRMDAKVSQVAIGDSPAQAVDLSSATADGSTRLTTEGWLRIRIINTSTGAVEATVLNRSLGSFVYENGNTTVAYQGGGVWREHDGNSVMVSKPEFHYRGETLTFRFLNLTGSAGSDELTVQDAGQSVQQFPNESSDLLNPVRNRKIRVTVHSRYYQGWGSHFEDRTDGGVEYDHGSDEVTLTLLKRTGSTRITDAMLVNGGGGRLRIQSGKNSVVNSYNSSAISPTLGPSSPPSETGDADIQTTKDIDFSGNAQVTGNLTTSGTVTGFSGSPGPPYRVGGNLQYGAGSVSGRECNRFVAGWCAQNSSIEDPEPIDNEIQNTITELNDSNDNAGEPCFSENNGIEFGGSCGSTVELEAGNYYTTDNLQVQASQKLLLNTTGGEIRIAVDDGQSVQFQQGNVTVLGNGTARTYGTYQYQIQGGKVWNRGWDATQFWLYCSADCQVQIDNNPTFVGVIYAPSESGATSAQVQIGGGNTEVYGAIVGGGDSQLKSNADIHFDRAIKSTTPMEKRFLPSISYLHVRTHQVNVSAG